MEMMLGDRMVQVMGWQADPAIKPWSEKHERVFIPFTPMECRNSVKRGHMQIVRRDKLRKIPRKVIKLKA